MKKNIFKIVLFITITTITLSAEVFAAAPSTGISKLDAGGWKIVSIFQSAIFWLSMIYTFKSLLEIILHGVGSWKKVGSGFLLCIMNYLIPFLFTIVRDAFK